MKTKIKIIARNNATAYLNGLAFKVANTVLPVTRYTLAKQSLFHQPPNLSILLIRLNRTPDELAYSKVLTSSETGSSKKRDVYKLFGIVAFIFSLGLISMWAFSPAPINLDYKPDHSADLNNLAKTAIKTQVFAAHISEAPQFELNLIEQKLQKASNDLAILEGEIAIAYASNTLLSQDDSQHDRVKLGARPRTNFRANPQIALLANAAKDNPALTIITKRTPEIVLAAAAPEIKTALIQPDSFTLQSLKPLITPKTERILIDLPAAKPLAAEGQAIDSPLPKPLASPLTRPLTKPALKPIKTKPSNIVPDNIVKAFKIKSGDTLGKLFNRADLHAITAINVAKIKAARPLKYLSIGKTLRFNFDADNNWKNLEYGLDKLNTLVVTPTKDSFDVTTHTKVYKYRSFEASGKVTSTLGDAFENANLPFSLSQELVDIYKWEIDFARDLRAGDTFSIIYQKAFIDNTFIETGPILAASFRNAGRSIKAVRYTDSNGLTAYFQPNGESLRRGFLRTPVKLARISSGFGKRKHPIKKTWKTHKGVDYAAKRGTPILSTADGVVQFAGRKGGYGKVLILRHGSIYTTLYAHMSRFKKGMRKGKPVKQGEVIGYVGHTGWATGDHVHYEFRINNRHKNPLKVKLPKTLPLAKKERSTFKTLSQPLLTQLSDINPNVTTIVASTTAHKNNKKESL